MVGGRALVYCTSWDSVSTPRHLSGRGVGWILMARRLSCVFRALLILLRRSLVFLGFYSSVGVLALNNLLSVYEIPPCGCSVFFFLIFDFYIWVVVWLL